MNERIKELAEQAGFGDGQITDIDLPSEVRVIIALYANFDPEKFAELIVQDINNTILHTARWHQEVEKDDNTVTALCDLVKDIREEYGVE